MKIVRWMHSDEDRSWFLNFDLRAGAGELLEREVTVMDWRDESSLKMAVLESEKAG